MNSEKRLKHLIQKYPSIVLPLSTPLHKKHPRIPLPSTTSLKKASRSRSRKPSRVLRMLVAEALTCSQCAKILTQPVTLSCGDTFCKACLEMTPRCKKCGEEVGKEYKCNVVLKDLVERVTMKGEGTVIKVSHNYELRSKSCNVNQEKKRPLATVKRKQTSVLTANLQLAETIAGIDSEALSSCLTCTLCTSLLSSPLTTPCGHTYCRGCVARLLDYALGCPLCMAPLPRAALRSTGTTHALENLVHTWGNGKMDVVHDIEDDLQMPVFICTSAYPYICCPLYVYEPRYRLLTRRVLQSSKRQFAMAAPTSDLGHDRFAAVGTVLEVKDAVYLEDGTSILTTVGVRRFKVMERGEKDGYDTAVITYLPDNPPSPSTLSSLHTLHSRVYTKASLWVSSLSSAAWLEISGWLGGFPIPEPGWWRLSDGPRWAWWLAAVLPLARRLQLALLATTSLEKRLRALDALLDRVEGRAPSLQQNCKHDDDDDWCHAVAMQIEG